jgi:Flp pilus assembly pilin Flp
MLNQIKMFMLDESGLETVEWAVVGGVIVAATAVTFGLIGDAVILTLQSLLGFL